MNKSIILAVVLLFTATSFSQEQDSLDDTNITIVDTNHIAVDTTLLTSDSVFIVIPDSINFINPPITIDPWIPIQWEWDLGTVSPSVYFLSEEDRLKDLRVGEAKTIIESIPVYGNQKNISSNN